MLNAVFKVEELKVRTTLDFLEVDGSVYVKFRLVKNQRNLTEESKWPWLSPDISLTYLIFPCWMAYGNVDSLNCWCWASGSGIEE